MRRETIPAELKRQVAQRAHGVYEYCLCPLALSTSPFEIEHIVPISAGGTSEPYNLALSCSGCNPFKSERTRVTDTVIGREVRLYHPRQDRWGDHFVWSSDFMAIVGITDVGRAMIAALQLNRVGVQNQRKSLLRDGLHPPTF